MWYAMYKRLDVHVITSNLDVIRKFSRTKLTKTARKDRHPRARRLRKEMYRAILAEHAKAQELYREIMGTRIANVNWDISHKFDLVGTKMLLEGITPPEGKPYALIRCRGAQRQIWSWHNSTHNAKRGARYWERKERGNPR